MHSIVIFGIIVLLLCLSLSLYVREGTDKKDKDLDKLIDEIETAPLNWRYAKDETEDGQWIEVIGGYPISFDTALIERLLWEYVDQHSTQKFEEKKKYTFQYQAVSADSVLIKAMCFYRTNTPLDEVFFVITDGGSCFFSLKYNPQTDSFSDLYVHGEA